MRGACGSVGRRVAVEYGTSWVPWTTPISSRYQWLTAFRLSHELVTSAGTLTTGLHYCKHGKQRYLAAYADALHVGKSNMKINENVEKVARHLAPQLKML